MKAHQCYVVRTVTVVLTRMPVAVSAQAACSVYVYVIRQPTKMTKDVCQIWTVHYGVVGTQEQDFSSRLNASDLCDLS
jgi:hypothetical protein